MHAMLLTPESQDTLLATQMEEGPIQVAYHTKPLVPPINDQGEDRS